MLKKVVFNRQILNLYLNIEKPVNNVHKIVNLLSRFFSTDKEEIDGGRSQIQLRPVLQTERWLLKPPSGHVHKLEGVVFTQQFIIAQYVNLQNIHFVNKLQYLFVCYTIYHIISFSMETTTENKTQLNKVQFPYKVLL